MNQEIEKILEKYISNSSAAVKNMIASSEWSKTATSIGEKFKIEDTSNESNFKNEILFVLIGMEPIKDFTENLKNEVGLDENTAKQITEEVDREIFSKVRDELDEIDKQMTENEKVGQAESQEPAQINKSGVTQRSNSGVGQDFEKIILNQARAMQPAKLAAGGIMNYESRIMNGKEEKPGNLPIEQSDPVKVSYYPKGQDPYKEPLD